MFLKLTVHFHSRYICNIHSYWNSLDAISRLPGEPVFFVVFLRSQKIMSFDSKLLMCLLACINESVFSHTINLFKRRFVLSGLIIKLALTHYKPSQLFVNITFLYLLSFPYHYTDQLNQMGHPLDVHCIRKTYKANFNVVIFPFWFVSYITFIFIIVFFR